MRRPIAWLTAVTMVAGSPTVADTIRNETVSFTSGTSGTTLTGQVKGYDSVQYAMGVTMGQKPDVQPDSGNSSLYFTVTASGASAAPCKLLSIARSSFSYMPKGGPNKTSA